MTYPAANRRQGVGLPDFGQRIIETSFGYQPYVLRNICP